MSKENKSTFHMRKLPNKPSDWLIEIAKQDCEIARLEMENKELKKLKKQIIKLLS